ncbi:MAG: PilZ domain-containing protein [Syntrophaceae bacterium]|nr:PilZ domain-containing protein [Syntrophaceae bacterium]
MEKKAEYKITSSVKNEILEIVITGRVTKDYYKNMENEFNDILASTKIEKLLLDVRKVKGRVGYLEAYSRVRNYSAYSHVKTAIVDIPENADFQDFQEKVAYGAGLSLKWFTDIDLARLWLKGKQKGGEQNAIKERRKAERLKEFNEVTVYVIPPKNKISYKYSENISLSGTKIRGEFFLPVDTLVRIDFKLKTLEKQITALGKVKWIKIINKDKYYEAGVEFVDTPNKATKKIQNYISWKRKSKNLNPFLILTKINEPKSK